MSTKVNLEVDQESYEKIRMLQMNMAKDFAKRDKDFLITVQVEMKQLKNFVLLVNEGRSKWLKFVTKRVVYIFIVVFMLHFWVTLVMGLNLYNLLFFVNKRASLKENVVSEDASNFKIAEFSSLNPENFDKLGLYGVRGKNSKKKSPTRTSIMSSFDEMRFTSSAQQFESDDSMSKLDNSSSMEKSFDPGDSDNNQAQETEEQNENGTIIKLNEMS